MAHGNDLFGLDQTDTAESTFDTVYLGGYSKSQVDRAMARNDAVIAALTAERDESLLQLQAYAVRLQQLQQEMHDLRRHTAANAMVSFRHLGPRVEQILTLAEEQAEAIRAGAAHEIAAQRTEAERMLAEARAQAHQATSDFEIALAARRHEEEQASGQRRAALHTEIAQVQEYAAKLRADAEAALQAAREEAGRIVAAGAAQFQQARAQADATLHDLRSQLDREHAQRDGSGRSP